MWNKDEGKGESHQTLGAINDKVGEVVNTDREQVIALPPKAKDLMDAWVRERKEALAKQLAEPVKKQDLGALREEERAKDRWENEGGLGQPLHVGEDAPWTGVTCKVTQPAQPWF